MDFTLPVPDLAAERLGNTDTPGVWHFDSGLPGRALMLSALVHGNELCGAWALKDLLASGLRPRRGSLTLRSATCRRSTVSTWRAMMRRVSSTRI